MSRFTCIEPEKAEGKTKEVLDKIQSKMGKVPNIFRTMANAPAAVEAYLALTAALSQTGLTIQQREAIALVVAVKNKCDYCVAAHSFIAQKSGMSADEVSSALTGKSSDLKTQAIINLAKAIVEKNANLCPGDYSDLESGLLTAQDVIEIIAVVSLNIFTNYFNHIADPEIDFPKVSASSYCSCCCGA